MIGRHPERAELLRHLESALAGHGLLVLIGGEPGIGKTHLTRAILSEAARRGCYTTVGHCYEMEGAPPYVPFIEMLEYAARVVPRESFRYALGDAAPEVAKLMPELRRMFSDIPSAVELPAEQQRRFLFNAYREFVERSARVTPIVAVFEDLPWADEPTLLLLQHLVQTVATVPMLMIGTYRDLEVDVTRPFARILESLIRERRAARMTLRRLPQAGVKAMLAALGGQTPPSSLTRVVFEGTEGNPFFVEEVFRHLAEEGKLFDEKGAWRLGLRKDQLQVPEGVRLVLGRRLERLGGKARGVLTTAAVIGRSFSIGLLEDLEDACSTPDAKAALEAIEEAERAHLVMAEHAGRETRYRFVHELVRQTLAETLSLPRRQRLHARIADAIERMYGTDLGSQTSALAHHLYQAGAMAESEKAVAYLMMAARFASKAAAHEDALTNIDHALSLMVGDRDPRIIELCIGRAVALRSLSRFCEAVNSYERAIALSIEEGNVIAAAEASFHLGYIHLWNADTVRAVAVTHRALRLLGSEPSPLRHHLLLCKAAFLGAFGEIEAAFATLSDAKLIEESLPETRADGFASMCEAHLRFEAAQISEAAECAWEAIARFAATGNIWGEVEMFEPGNAAFWLGHPTGAEAFIRETLAKAERVGHQNAVWAFKAGLTQMHMVLGDLERAERAAHESFEFCESFSGGWRFLDALFLGSITHYRGRLEEAAMWFRRGMDTEPRSFMLGLLSGGLFWTLAAQNDPAAVDVLAKVYPNLPVPGRLLSIGACGCLGFAVEGLAWLQRREEAAALQPHAEHVVKNGPFCVYSQHLFRTSAAIAAACARNWSRAEEHHQAAICQADTAPYRVAQPIARYWYAEMLLMRGAAGDTVRARALLSEALVMFESRGMPSYARRASERVSLKL